MINSHLLFKTYKVSAPSYPLKIVRNIDYFKMFMSDIGLLCTNASVSYSSYYNLNSDFKGYLAESFVSQQLSSINRPLYFYNRNTSEIDFLIEQEGNIIPIEVKSSNNNQSKSLKIYIENYKPAYSIRISTNNFWI